jgi:hypothetical protein
MLYTAPQLQQPVLFDQGALVIEVYVDSNGRVQDYRVLSNLQGSKDLTAQQKNKLIFTTFRPATLGGKATVGTAVLSFFKNRSVF